jgi:hypothetical protein
MDNLAAADPVLSWAAIQSAVTRLVGNTHAHTRAHPVPTPALTPDHPYVTVAGTLFVVNLHKVFWI